MRAALRWATAGIALALVVTGGSATADPAPQPDVVRQPPQPASGPGGSDYAHRGVRVTAGGTGASAWYVFEPVRPKPGRAPLAVVLHGYYEFSGYASQEALIRHTVRHGTVVIFPRWQTGLTTPCPGPYDIEPCLRSAVAGIKGGIRFLRAHPAHVQPRLGRTSYFGLSFGGIIAANLANRWRALDLPRPRAMLLDDIHDGGLAGPGEPALDDSMAGIPASTKIQCHVGADGIIAKDPTGSCNALFPKLRHIPNRNKDLVLTRTDPHGTPALSSGHAVCASDVLLLGAPNAYDWNFCWKVWDAIRSCALSGDDCRYALGATRRHRWLGRWSDGRPVKRLLVRNRGPITP